MAPGESNRPELWAVGGLQRAGDHRVTRRSHPDAITVNGFPSIERYLAATCAQGSHNSSAPSHTVSQRHRDDPLEVGEVEWLVDISERAELEGLTSERGVGIPGDHDYSGGWSDRTDSFEQFDAVRPGQRYVEQNQLGSREDRELQALIARQGTEDTVALCSETSMEDVDHIRVVVDYKNPAGWRCRRHGCGPSFIREPLLPNCYRW